MMNIELVKWSPALKKELIDICNNVDRSFLSNRLPYPYTETQLYKEGLEMNTLEEIKEYINQTRKTGLQYGNKYWSHDLVLSFYLSD